MYDKNICDMNRLPLGRLGFSNIRKLGKIYVDKTKLISKIAEQYTPLFLSRPRRFGKSLLINTLHSLFEKGLEDFHGLDIEKIWSDTTYKVIHFDFSNMQDNNIKDINFRLSAKIIGEFGGDNDIMESNSPKMQYPDIILDEIIKNIPDNSLVLLIDEYDTPLTHNLDKTDLLPDIINSMSNFYATIKQYTDKFRFIFITGITRISHISIFSAFNNLKDISLREEFNSLLGFTQEELVKYFDQYVENAAQILNVDKNEIYQRLEQYYDGFRFSLDAQETLYNPWSIISFLDSPKEGLQNYWFESGGTSSIIMHYIKENNSFDILNYQNRKIYKTKKELSARYDIVDIPEEILLFQAGYFTIRKETDQSAQLIFPNTEVEDSILDLYMTANNLKFSQYVRLKINDLSTSIDQKNLTNIINIFNAILNDCVSVLSKIFNDERSVRDVIYAALPQEIYLQKIKERETVHGFSDLELLTKKTHLIIEFKRTNTDRGAKSALQKAIEQIKNNNYGIGAFQTLKLYRVAMVISAEKKAILPKFCQEVF